MIAEKILRYTLNAIDFYNRYYSIVLKSDIYMYTCFDPNVTINIKNYQVGMNIANYGYDYSSAVLQFFTLKHKINSKQMKII